MARVPREKHCWIVPADDSQPVVDLGHKAKYDELQRIVPSGQPVEHTLIERTVVLYRGRVCDMIVNEEGYPLGLKLNLRATIAYQHNHHSEHCILGDAVIFEGWRF